MAEEKSSPGEYMSVADCVRQWKMLCERINQFCEDGEIIEAAKLDNAWIIPVDTAKPLAKSQLSRPVIPINKLQEAALEHIEKGDHFDVEERIIDGKPFIVSRVYPRQGPVKEELLLQFVVSMLKKEQEIRFNSKGIAELKTKLRRESDAAKETFESYLYSYRKRLKSYGFSEEDIEVLLEKIAADYEPFFL